MAINPQLAMLFADLAMSAGPAIVGSIVPKKQPRDPSGIGSLYDDVVQDYRNGDYDDSLGIVQSDWETDMFGNPIRRRR